MNKIPLFVENYFMKYGKIHKNSLFFTFSFHIVDFTKSYGIIETKNEKSFFKKNYLFWRCAFFPILNRSASMCGIGRLGGIETEKGRI